MHLSFIISCHTEAPRTNLCFLFFRFSFPHVPAQSSSALRYDPHRFPATAPTLFVYSPLLNLILASVLPQQLCFGTLSVVQRVTLLRPKKKSETDQRAFHEITPHTAASRSYLNLSGRHLFCRASELALHLSSTQIHTTLATFRHEPTKISEHSHCNTRIDPNLNFAISRAFKSSFTMPTHLISAKLLLLASNMLAWLHL